MIYIGIDPGKTGAMAVINDDTDEINLYNFEDGYLKVLENWECLSSGVVCFLERVHSQPNNGIKAAFSFGENYGYIRGLLEAFYIPYQTVPPQTWKREFSITADKKSSIECAQRLFPNVDLRRTERCKSAHDGKAEALLICEYGRRHFKGGQ